MEKRQILTDGKTFVREVRGMKNLHKILGPVMLAGAIMLGIGIYYSFVMAGIPYQDPPLELQMKYAVNAGIGDVLTRIGGGIACATLVVRAVLRVIMKNKGEQ